MSNSGPGQGKALAEHSWSVDAIEEGMVRVEEDGASMLSLSLRLFPDGTAEGQIFRVVRTLGADGVPTVHSMSLDPLATKAAHSASEKQTARIAAESRKGDRGGDVTL